MPRPPRPLCLPTLVSNPQARAEYIDSHPILYGPSSPHPSSSSQQDESRHPNGPPSPSSITDPNSHRASATTLGSLSSPVTPASTRTSLSVHNFPWPSDSGKRGSVASGGLLPTAGGGGDRKSWNLGLGGGEAAGSKPRASWQSAFSNTKSWFGNSASAEVKDASNSSGKPSSQKEIKLSPSMIAAAASTPAPSQRPMSSPYPSGPEPPIPSPTRSTFDSTRSPRVGSGLRYYTESNPAPSQIRVQIPDPIDLQDHDRPEPPRPPIHDPNVPTPTLTTFVNTAKQLPSVPDVTVRTISPPDLDLGKLKDPAFLRDENRGPLSPPPTPPVHEREGDVPRIRVSSGDHL